jgi:DNA-binding XRE family transcriptional regulator
MSPSSYQSAEAGIADRIKEVRLSLGLTQEQFADVIGVSRTHLASIETYRVEPSIQAVLGVLVLDLRHKAASLRPVDPTWLMLGPHFEPDQWAKFRTKFVGGTEAYRAIMADVAQRGSPPYPCPEEAND